MNRLKLSSPTMQQLYSNIGRTNQHHVRQNMSASR